jgi:ADP-heptose:LPS heptosyltransferase
MAVMVHSPIETPRSLFVLKPSSLGDIVHTLPAVARLKAAWPACRIAWLVNAQWAPLLAGNPDIAEIVIFPRQEFRGLRGARKVGPWLRGQVWGRKPDLALDFQGLLRSALIGRLSRPRHFLGLANAREGAPFLYSIATPPPVGRVHAVEKCLALADAALALAGVPAGSTAPLRFPLPAGEPPGFVGPRLGRDFILLHPFSRGADKSLDAAQVRAFCKRLAPRPVALVGKPPADMAFDAPPGVHDFLGKTSLTQLIWLLRRAAFVISVDSGPMHLAAALGRPLVAIHTWSDPRRVGPFRPEAWVWKSGQLLQAGGLAAADPSIFGQAAATPTLAQIHAICALATSS